MTQTVNPTGISTSTPVGSPGVLRVSNVPSMLKNHALASAADWSPYVPSVSNTLTHDFAASIPTGWGNTAGLALTHDTTQGVGANGCALWTRDGPGGGSHSGTYLPTTNDATVGAHYRCTLWIKSNIALRVQPLLNFRNSSGVAVGNSFLPEEGNPADADYVTLVANTWTKITIYAKAPSSGVRFNFQWNATNMATNGDTVRVDDFIIDRETNGVWECVYDATGGYDGGGSFKVRLGPGSTTTSVLRGALNGSSTWDSQRVYQARVKVRSESESAYTGTISPRAQLQSGDALTTVGTATVVQPKSSTIGTSWIEATSDPIWVAGGGVARNPVMGMNLDMFSNSANTKSILVRVSHPFFDTLRLYPRLFGSVLRDFDSYSWTQGSGTSTNPPSLNPTGALDGANALYIDGASAGSAFVSNMFDVTEGDLYAYDLGVIAVSPTTIPRFAGRIEFFEADGTTKVGEHEAEWGAITDSTQAQLFWQGAALGPKARWKVIIGHNGSGQYWGRINRARIRHADFISSTSTLATFGEQSQGNSISGSTWVSSPVRTGLTSLRADNWDGYIEYSVAANKLGWVALDVWLYQGDVASGTDGATQLESSPGSYTSFCVIRDPRVGRWMKVTLLGLREATQVQFDTYLNWYDYNFQSPAPLSYIDDGDARRVESTTLWADVDLDGISSAGALGQVGVASVVQPTGIVDDRISDVAVRRAYYFVTPTVREPYPWGEQGLFRYYLQTEGVTWYKVGGVWTSTNYPPDDLVADEIYHGGREYEVTGEKAAELQALGFTVRTELR